MNLKSLTISILMPFFTMNCLNKIIYLEPLQLQNETLDITDYDNFSKDKIENLLDKQEKNNKPYIIARVVTQDDNEEYVNYHDAHGLNKYIFNQYPIYTNKTKWIIGKNDELFNITNTKTIPLIDPITVLPLKSKNIKYFKIDSKNDNYFNYIGSFEDLIKGSSAEFLQEFFYKNDLKYSPIYEQQKKEKLERERILQDQIKKKKIENLKKIKALNAIKFKNTTTLLSKYATVIRRYNNAKLQKNLNLINKLEPVIATVKKKLIKIAINIKNDKGQTPLMINPLIAPIVYAIDKKRATNIVNAKDNNGKTILQYLIQSPYAMCVYLYKALTFANLKINPKDINSLSVKLKNNPVILKKITEILKTGLIFQI